MTATAVEPITVLFLTITMRATEWMSAGCTGPTSIHNVGVTASSLRRPSTPNGQHGTRWSLNTRLGSSKDGDNQKMYLEHTLGFTIAGFCSYLLKILALPEQELYQVHGIVTDGLQLLFGILLFYQLIVFLSRKEFSLILACSG